MVMLYFRRTRSLRIFLMLCLVTGVSCRRVAPPGFLPGGAGRVERFFSRSSGDPCVQAIGRSLRRQQERQPFIDDLVDRAGYPLWDRAIRPGIKNVLGRASPDRAVIVYIPFSRDSSTSVAAILSIMIKDRDTTMRMLYRSQYHSLPYRTAQPAGASAEALAPQHKDRLSSGIYTHTAYYYAVILGSTTVVLDE